MRRVLSMMAAVPGALGVTAPGQDARPVDARAALQTALTAMGGTNLKTIQYSGAGWSSRIGQTYTLNEDWPKYQVTDYTRAIDYEAKWSREDYTRQQGNYPTLGRPPMAQERVTSISSGTLAWDMQADKPVPFTRMYLDGVPYGDLRQLELALTPHGALKAGLAAPDATAILDNADLYPPPAQGAPPPATPPVTMRTLHQNMLKLKLDVAQHVPTHGRVGHNDEFLKLVTRAPQQTGTGSAQQ